MPASTERVRLDDMDDRGPSVIALNGTLVSLAVIEFMVFITGVPRPPKRSSATRGPGAL